MITKYQAIALAIRALSKDLAECEVIIRHSHAGSTAIDDSNRIICAMDYAQELREAIKVLEAI